MKLGFCSEISEERSNNTFYEVCPVGAKLFHGDGLTYGRTYRGTDGHTDMMTTISAFRIFSKAPEN